THFRLPYSLKMSVDWGAGPMWGALGSAERYKRKFNDSDIGNSDSRGASVLLTFTTFFILAVLAYLVIEFIRRACFPLLQRKPSIVDQEANAKLNGASLPV
ncbi:hypothetical protein PENTCL1PPCAC_14286, partial [Pristionchus entomophagus]